jgi:hypothetical protein
MTRKLNDECEKLSFMINVKETKYLCIGEELTLPDLENNHAKNLHM